MQKRVDYIIEDGRNNGNSSGARGVVSGETLAEAYAAAVASGQLMQVHAHSIGLLFEQSVTQQNNSFLLANTNSSKLVSKLLSNDSNTTQQLLNSITPSTSE